MPNDPTTGMDKLRQSPPPVPAPEVIDGPLDTPPTNGEFHDWDGAQHDPETVAEGNQMGRDIDPDDDEDNGLGPGEA